MLIQAFTDTREYTHYSPQESVGTGLDTLIEKIARESPKGALSFNIEPIGYRNSGKTLETTYKVYYFPNRGAYYQC